MNSNSFLVPPWAKPDAFPKAPDGYGVRTASGKMLACHDVEGLKKLLEQEQVQLVWTPHQEYLVLAEEVPELRDLCETSYAESVLDQYQNSLKKIKFFGVIAVLFICIKWIELKVSNSLVESLYLLGQDYSLAFALLLYLSLVVFPFWQSRQAFTRYRTSVMADRRVENIAVWRFELWLSFKQSACAMALIVLMSVIFLLQLYFNHSHYAAGLWKPAYLGGESWRLLTAPLLHGNLLHLFMNMSAIWYLGKRIDVLVHWSYILTSFLISAVAGSWLSVWWMPDEGVSLGASSGIMGMLGFLLVFETKHAQLVPRRVRRQLLAMVCFTALMGLIGYRFIDNAGHLGGLCAGIAYASVIFSRSGSVEMPKVYLGQRFFGVLAAVIIVCSAWIAFIKMSQMHFN